MASASPERNGATISARNGEQSFADLLERLTRMLEQRNPAAVEKLLQAHPDHACRLRDLMPIMAAMTGCGSQSNFEPREGPQPLGDEGAGGFLGDFRILREIGRGGMGIVYEAEQLSLRRRVALKVLPFAAVLDKRSLQRFKNEALAAAALDHPSIVSVHFVGEERGVHFFAMQLVEGQSLAEVIEGRRTGKLGRGNDDSSEKRLCASPFPIPPSTFDRAQLSTLSGSDSREFHRTVARLGIQAARALQHAHDQGVLHRDIKPGNLMLDSEGQLYITDFGLARIETDVAVTMTGDLLGTLRYMSPEQVLAKRRVIDHRADVYSLGATLYELLALQPAFDETDRSELLRRIAFDEPRPLRNHDRRIPVELETIVLKSMAKDREDRYQSALELAEDLERFLEHRPILGKPPNLFERCVKWSRRHPTGAALVAVVLFSSIGLSAGALWHARTLSAALRESEENRDLAEANEQRAVERERLIRHHQYAWRMKVAGDAWETRNIQLFRDVMFKSAEDETEADLRGFEWHYLWKLCNPKCEKLTGHRKAVNCITYSPDYKLVATASEDGTVRIWQADTHELEATLVGHTSCVNKLLFAPDGTWIATSSCDKTVKIWDATTFAEICSLPHEIGVHGLAISRDGKTIAAGLGDGSDSPPNDDVVIWDVATQQRKRVLNGHSVDVRAAVFAADGTLITGSLDRTIRRWDINTGEQLQVLSHPEPGEIQCIAFSLDGSVVVTGSGNRTAVVWEPIYWVPKAVVRTNMPIHSVAVSPDGARFATGDDKGLVELWDSASGAPKGVLLASNDRLAADDARIAVDGRINRVLSLAFSPDGTHLLSGSPDAVTRYWDLGQLSGEPNIFTLDIRSPAMAIDESLKTVVDLQPRIIVEQWTLKPSTAQFVAAKLVCKLTKTAVLFALGPGNLLAAAGPGDGQLQIIDTDERKVFALLSDPRGPIEAAEFLDDGRKLLVFVGSTTDRPDWSASVWDLATLQQLFELPEYAHATPARGAHSAAHVFAIGVGSAIEIYDVFSGQSVGRIDTQSQQHIRRFALSPDGQLLATVGDYEYVFKVWDWARHPERPKFIGGNGNSLSDITFSPDGRTLATGENSSVTFWNTETGQEMLRLPVTGEPAQLRFSADGKRVAACGGFSPDGLNQVRIWSVEP